MSSKYHQILMRIKYTRYKTVESSSSFLVTCTLILFIKHKFNILLRMTIPSSMAASRFKNTIPNNCVRENSL